MGAGIPRRRLRLPLSAAREQREEAERVRAKQRAAEARRLKTEAARAYGAALAGGLGAGVLTAYGGGVLARQSVTNRKPDRYRRLMEAKR